MTRQRWGTTSPIVWTLVILSLLSVARVTGPQVRAAQATAAPPLGMVAGVAQDPLNSTSCHVGPPYTSYTGTDTIPNPSTPPPMGPAGSKLLETEFPVQNQIVRVTDENTAALLGQPQGEFSVVSATWSNRWSPDDTHVIVEYAPSAMYFIYHFDPNCADGANYMNVAPDNFNNHSSLAPFGNPIFNAVSGSTIIAYGVSGNQIQSCTHNHAAGSCPASVLFDVGADSNIPPFYVRGLNQFTATKDQDANIAFAAAVQFRPEPPGCQVNCFGQDSWDGVVACVKNYDGAGHSGCVYWDTYLGNMGGDFGPQCTACPGVPQSMLLHSVVLNFRQSGKISDLWAIATAPESDLAHGGQFWNVGTTTVVHPTVAPLGHATAGTRFYANNSNGFNRDARSWLTRSFSSVANPVELIPAPPPPSLGRQDMHPALSNGEQYIYNNLFQPVTGNCAETTAWQCENIAVQTFPPHPGKTNAIVWRFVHNWSFSTGAVSDFWHLPKGEVSPDGKFMCFSSDWGNTLPGSRSDVFCNEMK